MKNEVKVGVFVFIAILLLFFLTTQVGSFRNFTKKGYVLYTDLQDAAGLEPNSKVKANGIDIGYVKSLDIVGNKIRMKLFIKEGVNIPQNSVLSPMQTSMLGGKYAAIKLGDATSVLEEGAQVSSQKGLASITKASDSMMEAADEFKSFIVEFRQVFDGESRESLKSTFLNLQAITAELRAFTKLNRLNQTADNFNQMAENLSKTGAAFSKTAETINTTLPGVMANLDILVRDLRQASHAMKDKLPALADQFAQVGKNLESIITDNKKPLSRTISAADTFFSTGEDAFNKVDALLENIDKIQLEVAMRSEWMSQDKYNKGYLSFDYRPSDSKSYKFDVLGMDDYSSLDAEGKLIAPKLHDKTKLLVSAQIAKRFEDTTLRAGLIESTFGAGFDYYMLHDSIKASAELFDFNAQRDVRGENPHAKLSSRYTLLKHIDVYAGVDNFLNDDATNIFLGLGVHFYDDDLKTLIMAQSLGSFAQ